MKPLLLLISISLGSISAFSQQWGICTISQFTNEANDVEINNNNESYTVGYITGETAFSSTSLVPSASGNGDIYIAKYSSTGALIWQKTFGGNYSDRAIDLAIGPDQNLLVTGQFFGTVNFGGTILTSTANSKDIFILKLDPAGNVIWARKEGGALAENAYGITCDYQNNVILTGQFQGTASIGNNTFTSATDPNTNLPSFDFFISKYDSNGNPLWSLNGFAEYEDRGLAVAVDNGNNIYFTGQFSKDLTFSANFYPNLGYNIGFLCKLNPSGQLQFFNQLKAGMTNPYDLEVNNDNEVVVVGDFLGNMNYYDVIGTHPIQNAFDKHIFVIKTTANGSYQWNYTLGSANDISARSVSMDPHKDIFVTGYFKCDLSQIQDTAQATFNSIGYKDGYLLKVDNSGQHQYIKHFGGKMDDEGHGVAIRQNDKPLICGSFTKDLNFAYNSSTNITTNVDLHSLIPYSNETYHLFLYGDSSRNSFLVNNVNDMYETLNYYIPFTIDSLVGNIVSYSPNYLPLDTTHFCDSDILSYNTLTWEHYGPSYSFLWNTGDSLQSIGISQTGDYWVHVKRDDACATENDSIYAISEPIPLLPNLTDNYGINTNQPAIYNNYHFCYPDSLTIHYTNLQPGVTLTTQEPTGNVLLGVGPFTIHEGGHYFVEVTNQYCGNSSEFTILYDEPVPFDTLDLDIIMNTSVPTGDSITICLNEDVCFAGIDLITNPLKNWGIEIPHPIYSAIWTISGSFEANQNKLKTCFSPQTSGWYNVQLDVIVGYNNLCGLDTVHYSKSKQFYIHVNPVPTWSGTISGSNLLCENGSVFLHVSNPNPAFTWNGPGIIWNNGSDSIEVNAAGNYTYSGTLTGSVTGCSASFGVVHMIVPKIAPAIVSNPSDGIVCPYDSVLMILPSNFVSYHWIGPSGDSLASINQCYGQDLGFYYCHVLDNEGCHLTTPPFELKEYTTPSITIMPDAYLCPGENTTIQVAYSGTPIFSWSPINSSQDHITVNTPGIYTVQISQCGFTITDSIEIIDASFSASISISDSTLCYQDTAIITGTPYNLNYEWNTGQVTNGFYEVSEVGTYSAQVTNEFGCVIQTNTVTLGLIPESTPPSIPSQTVCAGSNVNLSSTANYLLDWFSPNDTSLLMTGNQLSLVNIMNDTTFLVAYQSLECPPAFGSVSVHLVDSLGNYTIHGDSVLCQLQNGVFYVNTTTETISWSLGSINLGNMNPITIPFNSFSVSNEFSVQISNQCYSTIVVDSVTLLPTTQIELANDSITLCYYDTDIATVITPNIDSISWTSNLGTVTSDELYLSGSMDYGVVYAIGYDSYGCATDTAQLVVTTTNFTSTIDLDFTSFCIGDSGTITLNTNADSILLTTPFGIFDTTTISIPIDSIHQGTYTIDYWGELGCLYHDTIVIPLYNSPNLEILPDSIFCINDIFSFYFPNDTNSYQWMTYGSSTTIPIEVDQNLILVATTPNGCVSYDTLVVHTVNCDDALPNIITPNNDGTNDYFIIDDAYAQAKNELLIFNRWGNIVFEAQPYRNDWNGSGLANGVYFYIYFPNGSKDPISKKEGYLHIIGD